MAWLALGVLALVAAGGFSDIVTKAYQKPADHTCLEHQQKVLTLFFHVHEPTIHFKELLDIEKTWDIQKNAGQYNNATAVHSSITLLSKHWFLPRGVPFSIHEKQHRYEALTFFHLMFSAKDFDTFFNTAVYLRCRLNEYLFNYIVSAVIYHRHDTRDIIVPPIYNTFPSFFFNNEIMTTAQRIITHGQKWIEHYPSTYTVDQSVIIKHNETLWPYLHKEAPVAYFTHDPAINTLMYTVYLNYPFWMGQETCPLKKDRRGELFWWWHKQLLAFYYMERLSNGLDEIPELKMGVVEEGLTFGLAYQNGIPFPTRPDHFHLDSPWIIEKIQEIEEYESRIRDAIDKGFIITESGGKMNIHDPESIDILGRLVQANVDSPNPGYYKDFISIWKKVLGNSRVKEPLVYYKGFIPLVLPSGLELDQTTCRDPAFYMIWKRVLKLFDTWHEQLPPYSHEQLALPGVTIEKVEVDKLVTYFEYTYFNITNGLYLNEFESEYVHNTKSVLVERPRLNHKTFTVRVTVKSEIQKDVTIRFFLGPKLNSMGREIPLHVNSHNFFQFDEFKYTLSQGENVITRLSTDTLLFSNDLYQSFELYEKVNGTLEGHGQYTFDMFRKNDGWPRRLLLPRGHIGGMPFVLFVYISEYHAPAVPFGTGYDPVMSLGLGTGARRLTSDPLRFPIDRPLHEWQVADLKNIYFRDVMIYHRNNPDVVVDHVY